MTTKKKKRSKKKSNAGRKSIYPRIKKDFPLIFQYLLDGLTEVEICKKLGIAPSTFTKYKAQEEELRELLREGKKRPDAEVKQSLFRSATGYEYQEQKITVDAEGKTKVEKTTKYMAPAPLSIFYWLNNRDPENWRRQRKEKPNNPQEFETELEKLTEEDLDKMIEDLQ